jgi:thiosulfate/3-mercaptopyruvate sulfurtransferase
MGRGTLAAPPPGRVVALPYTTLLGANGIPKPAAELWKLIDQAGVPRHAELVFVADDVAEAAVGYVVFKLMGWPDLKVWLR